MIRHITLPALAALSLVACKANRTDVDYDTADPYGIPDYSNAGAGAETANYQAVNPPADSTYGPAAYEDTSTPAATPATPATPARPAAPAARTTGSRTHTIAKGDTLWGLSKKYGVTADAIKSANKMTGDTVVLGKTIKIPAN